MENGKVKSLSERFGMKIKMDPTMDKYSKVDLFPEKTKKAREIISKTRLKIT